MGSRRLTQETSALEPRGRTARSSAHPMAHPLATAVNSPCATTALDSAARSRQEEKAHAGASSRRTAGHSTAPPSGMRPPADTRGTACDGSVVIAPSSEDLVAAAAVEFVRRQEDVSGPSSSRTDHLATVTHSRNRSSPLLGQTMKTLAQATPAPQPFRPRRSPSPRSHGGLSPPARTFPSCAKSPAKPLVLQPLPTPEPTVTSGITSSRASRNGDIIEEEAASASAHDRSEVDVATDIDAMTISTRTTTGRSHVHTATAVLRGSLTNELGKSLLQQILFYLREAHARPSSYTARRMRAANGWLSVKHVLNMHRIRKLLERHGVADGEHQLATIRDFLYSISACDHCRQADEMIKDGSLLHRGEYNSDATPSSGSTRSRSHSDASSLAGVRRSLSSSTFSVASTNVENSDAQLTAIHEGAPSTAVNTAVASPVMAPAVVSSTTQTAAHKLIPPAATLAPASTAHSRCTCDRECYFDMNLARTWFRPSERLERELNAPLQQAIKSETSRRRFDAAVPTKKHVVSAGEARNRRSIYVENFSSKSSGTTMDASRRFFETVLRDAGCTAPGVLSVRNADAPAALFVEFENEDAVDMVLCLKLKSADDRELVIKRKCYHLREKQAAYHRTRQSATATVVPLPTPSSTLPWSIWNTATAAPTPRS